jgi:RimJ/RimL family protein N-acetyltransferase
MHLGGPESLEQIRSRHERYCRDNEEGVSRLFVIVTATSSEAAGWVGYWPRDWRGQAVWETGWHVLPEFQGRGLATAGTRSMLARAAGEGARRYVHAFPSVENAPSNAICAKAGFMSLGETEFEYPPGHAMRCIDWRFDLETARGPSTMAGQ